MRSILTILATFVLTLAWSAGTEETQTAVKLYRGTSIIAASDPNHATYRPNFTFDACTALKAERWQAEAATKTSGSKVTYKCQVEERSIITFHPAPTCPALPAPEARVVDCPAGTTGAYTQTLSYTSSPYPTCAVPGEWTPAEPPASICVPVPPPTEQWTFCSNEYQTCSFSGTRRARFGLNTSWVERDVTASGGGVPCRIATFGSDPVPGATKRCELLAVTTEPTFTATLSWTPPTQNSDATTLTNLAGYRIHYGASPTELVSTVQITTPGASSYTISNLAAGTYYFAVRAYTSAGTESLNSNIVNKVVN
jgi:hypothetical protein